jgi:hypothetical protein
MRTSHFLLLTLLVLFFSCSEDTDHNIPCEASGKLDNTKVEANQHIYGRWKLIKIFAFRAPNVEVPDMEILFVGSPGTATDNQVAYVIQKGINIGTVKYTISESLGENKNKYLNINSGENITYTNGNSNIIRGQLRICQNELLLDNGMAFDAPGYLFKRI